MDKKSAIICIMCFLIGAVLSFAITGAIAIRNINTAEKRITDLEATGARLAGTVDSLRVELEGSRGKLDSVRTALKKGLGGIQNAINGTADIIETINRLEAGLAELELLIADNANY